MLAGLEVVTEGEIRLGDRELTDVHPRYRDIVMVLQNCALSLHMTVMANIGFPLRPRGVPKKEISAKVEGDRRDAGIERLPGPQTAQTLGWTASACSDRASDDPPAVYLPSGRLAPQPCCGGFIGSP